MINGEKERQTFDMLICSRLSPAALIGGKLLSGLINALLLIASSIPLFSLVFFFGGISPLQAFEALVIFADVTGRDPRTLGSHEPAAEALKITPALAMKLQQIAAETLAADHRDSGN